MTGVLDDALSPDSDPLAHRLASLSPLTKAVSDAALAQGAKRAQSMSRTQTNGGKDGLKKTSEAKKRTGAGVTTEAAGQKSVSARFRG